MELFGRLLQGRLYWIVGPEYDLCRPEFEYVLAACRRIDAVATVREPATARAELITRTGARIVTRSAREPERSGRRSPRRNPRLRGRPTPRRRLSSPPCPGCRAARLALAQRHLRERPRLVRR